MVFPRFGPSWVRRVVAGPHFRHVTPASWVMPDMLLSPRRGMVISFPCLVAAAAGVGAGAGTGAIACRRFSDTRYATSRGSPNWTTLRPSARWRKAIASLAGLHSRYFAITFSDTWRATLGSCFTGTVMLPSVARHVSLKVIAKY